MLLFSSRGQGELAVMSTFDVLQHSNNQIPVAGPSNQDTNAPPPVRRNQPLARQQNLTQHQLVRRPSPLERVPTEIIPSPPPTPPLQLTRQQLMLQEYGIKARDFAYESKLPPVPTVKKVANRPVETKSIPPPRTVQRAFQVPAMLDEQLKKLHQAKRRELMVSRVRMANGEIRPGVVEYDPESPFNSDDNILLLQGRKVTPFLFGLSPQKAAARAPQLEELQEFESQGSSQPQYDSQSQGESSSQPPLEPASQADSDLVETPLVTPSSSSACIILEPNTVPEESQQVTMPVDSQDVPMEDVSESQMGMPEAQSQMLSSDVEMETTLPVRQSISPPSITIRTTPSSSFSSPANGKKPLCGSPSLLFRRSSHARASSRGMSSPTLKRKRGSSFENEKRYHLRSKDVTVPSNRISARPRTSLPAMPSFQDTPDSPPQKGRRAPKGGATLSRTASHMRAKGKSTVGTDSSSRPLRRSTRTRHSIGARLGS